MQPHWPGYIHGPSYGASRATRQQVLRQRTFWIGEDHVWLTGLRNRACTRRSRRCCSRRSRRSLRGGHCNHGCHGDHCTGGSAGPLTEAITATTTSGAPVKQSLTASVAVTTVTVWQGLGYPEVNAIAQLRSRRSLLSLLERRAEHCYTAVVEITAVMLVIVPCWGTMDKWGGRLEVPGSTPGWLATNNWT